MKFRAWDKQNNKFASVASFVFLRCGDIDSPNRHYDMSYMTDDRFVFQFFTGFKDKNKKDICEGDITKDLDGEYGTVEFVDGTFLIREKNVIITFYSSLVIGNQIQPRVINSSTFEIVGNIFENPELLK